MSQIQLGWIEPEKRTNEQNDAHEAVMAAMPRFSAPPNPFGSGTPPKGTKVLLTDLWKHPKVVKALGYEFPGIHQITGSCVGAGGGNTIFTTNCWEVVKNSEREKIVLPFWLYPYGISRQLGGMRGRGEGSFGSTFAKACTDYGVPDNDLETLTLPKPQNSDQLVWGKSAEFEWSDGTRADQAVRAESKSRLIRTTTPVSSGEGVRDMILNGYSLTRACTTFCNIGTARVRNGALLGTQNGRGGHQESWLGYWHHPDLGELIWEMNQWGKGAYGTDPGGGPAGGCWIRLEEVHRICQSRDAEVFAFSQYDGYPSQPQAVDWTKERPLG